MVRNSVVCILLLSFSLLAQSATVIIFTPTDDAYVSSAYPATNFGDANSLISQYSSTDWRQIFLKYDISSIPSGKRIVSAHLRLNAEIVEPANASYVAYALYGYGSSDWTEQGITWQNRPHPDSPYSDQTNVSLGNVYWTMTDGVEYDYMNGSSYCSFAVDVSELNTQIAQFTSKETTNPVFVPILEIEYDNAFPGGDGTLESPFEIWTSEQMYRIGQFSQYWSNHFILMSDIDLSVYTGTEFNLIGNSDIPFSGSFDGNNHSISNFTYSSSWEDSIGLFRRLSGEDAEIRNLRLINPNVSADGSVGSLVASISGSKEFPPGQIVNCTIEGGRVYGTAEVGGLAGYNAGKIINCSSTCDVEADDIYAGGIAGYSTGGTFKNCVVNATVTSFWDAGGIVGQGSLLILNCHTSGTVNSFVSTGGIAGSFNGTMIRCSSKSVINGGTISTGGLAGGFGSSTILQCFFIGQVTGDQNVGGLAGSASTPFISNCYTMGSVSGGVRVGGLIGNMYDSGTLNNSFSISQVAGTSDVGAVVGVNLGTISQCYFLDSAAPDNGYGTPLDDPNMMIQTNFTDWDFLDESSNGENNIWRMCIDSVDYPRLSWEFAQNGDFACGGGTDILDLQALAEYWLLSETLNPTTFSYACDANGDGVIDLEDHSVLGMNW